MKTLYMALAGMLAIGAVNSASAMSAAGYGPCYIESQSLLKSGFSENTAYKPEAIAQFMSNDGVGVLGLDKLDPNCLYMLSYSCRVDHGMVLNKFVARVTDRRARVQSANIHWEITSPVTDALHVPL
jgi:hypothetical protein